MHPRILFAFSATRAHCWLMHHLLSTRAPRSFSAELLFSRSAPNLHWCVTLHLPLNFIRFLSTHLCSLSRFSWMAAQPLVYQPHLWHLYHQACWGCTLSLYPGHWWTSRTGLNPILTPCQLQASKWTLCAEHNLWTPPSSQFSTQPTVIHLTHTSWATRMLQETESKALLKSRQKTSTSLPSSIYSASHSITADYQTS